MKSLLVDPGQMLLSMEPRSGGANRNARASLGYRLHTITAASSFGKGLAGGNRIQATLVLERLV